MTPNDNEQLRHQMETQEIMPLEIRQLLVARYSLLHLYSDIPDIETMLPTIEEIRAIHKEPTLLEAVEAKYIIFINYLRKKAEKMTNEDEQKEILFPAEEVLTWLILKVGGQPIFYEVKEAKDDE